MTLVISHGYIALCGILLFLSKTDSFSVYFTQTCGFFIAETSLGKPRPGQFRIPHSLALIPDLSQLCVADRENGRIQCFRLETGEFTREIKHKAFGRELFAVSYVPGNLFSCSSYFKQLPCARMSVLFTEGLLCYLRTNINYLLESS